VRAARVSVPLIFSVVLLSLTHLDVSAQSSQNDASGSNINHGSASKSTDTNASDSAKPISRGNDLVEVLTDTQGVDFGPYLQKVLHRVRENWYKSIPPDLPSRKGRIEIEFAIRRDGSVSDMRPVSASEVESQEQLAWQGIATSGPFPPLPPDFKGDFLVLRFRFYYWPEGADFLEICGQARATTKVEAETIGKDQSTDLGPYIEAKVLPLLRANWYRMITKSSAKSGGSQTIDFTILKNGDLASEKTGLQPKRFSALRPWTPSTSLPHFLPCPLNSADLPSGYVSTLATNRTQSRPAR